MVYCAVMGSRRELTIILVGSFMTMDSFGAQMEEMSSSSPVAAPSARAITRDRKNGRFISAAALAKRQRRAAAGQDEGHSRPSAAEDAFVPGALNSAQHHH